MTRIVLLVVALAACTTTESTGIQTVSCPPDSTLTYANFGQSFIQNNCLSCHATKQRPQLSSQAEVQANADRILSAAVYTNAMPQDADMALTDRQTLGEWIACGAK
jgi:uncharacterized membrane protein